MIRKALMILSLIGLSISLGVWGMSYTVIGWSNGRTIISVSSGAFRYVEFVDLPPTMSKWWWSGIDSFDTGLIPSAGMNRGMHSLVLPFWIPCVLFAGVLWYCNRPGALRRRRQKRGLCVNCGYDLTGNVTGVCSECGATIGVEYLREHS